MFGGDIHHNKAYTSKAVMTRATKRAGKLIFGRFANDEAGDFDFCVMMNSELRKCLCAYYGAH